MNRFYLKIILPSVISILLFILTIFLIIIPQYQQSIMNGKREMIKELTNSAWSILSEYETDERNGLITREEAQKNAVSRIEFLRYGEESKDYFWITDLRPYMIMHPYRSDLNGKDLSDFSDPHGKKLFVEVVATVRESGHGYVDYMWQWKDDSLHIVPKLSYVKKFEPWGWVIGTGIYVEDVKKEINALTNKLTIISVGISGLIALLLLSISLQSLKIERERLKAVKELHDSKEKYRTLVEAATEGIVMITEGKISFLNNVIADMSGYDSHELINMPFTGLISEHNSKAIKDTFSKEVVKEGQYELNLKKKNGSFIVVLVTSSNAVLYNKAVSIMIVKDINIEADSNASKIDYQKLISVLNIGFFRVRIDHKGKFLYANETALRILGFDNFYELADTSFFDLIIHSDDKSSIRKDLTEKGYLKNKIFKLSRKNSEPAAVLVTLVTFEKDDEEQLICDGILEDVTVPEKKRFETNELIAGLKSSNFLSEQSVIDYVKPIAAIDPESTIGDAVKTLNRLKTDCLLLAKNEKEFIGIITNSDIQKRVLSLDLHHENPAYLIMSSPVVYLNESTSLIDAANICEEKSINHPVVRNAEGEILGVIKIHELFKVLKDSLSFLIAEIKNSVTNDELKHCYKKLQLLIKPLINSDVSVKHITGITSSFSDALTRRIVELTIKDIGNPPVEFSFICMGSEGRREETLLTDQDNAIIYENIPGGSEITAKEYFNKLGERVCNSLDQIGYTYCRGNIMAKNIQWCQPVSVWENYFSSWITTPEPQNLLDATIFFDFRNVYGKEEIADRLRSTISNMIKEHSMFLFHLANNAYNTKHLQIAAGSIIADKKAELIDLKNAVNPIIMFARIYSLQNNIWFSNTIERLNALKAMHIVNPTTADEMIYVYNFLMKLRFRNQLELSEKSQPLSNIINTKKLLDIETAILKKVLALIPAYQNKIAVDFRISV